METPLPATKKPQLSQTPSTPHHLLSPPEGEQCMLNPRVLSSKAPFEAPSTDQYVQSLDMFKGKGEKSTKPLGASKGRGKGKIGEGENDGQWPQSALRNEMGKNSNNYETFGHKGKGQIGVLAGLLFPLLGKEGRSFPYQPSKQHPLLRTDSTQTETATISPHLLYTPIKR